MQEILPQPFKRSIKHLLALLLLGLFCSVSFATNYIVNVKTDAGSASTGLGSGNTGDLRYCIVRANTAATGTAGLPDTIRFAIPGAGIQTIVLTSALPAILVSNLVIDGYSQKTIDPTVTQGSIGSRVLAIEIDCSNIGSAQTAMGIGVNGGAAVANITIDGLIINNLTLSTGANYVGSSYGYTPGIQIALSFIWIWGCYLGIDNTGSTQKGKATNIEIGGGSIITGGLGTNHHVTIGTNGDGINDANEGNLLGQSTGNNQTISLINAHNCKVSGNFIGVDKTGNALSSTVGTGMGIIFWNCINSYIGTDMDGVSDNLEGNVIAGTGAFAIRVRDNGVSGTENGQAQRTPGNNVVSGNYIGSNFHGTAALGTRGGGISILNSHGNLVGGNNVLQRNVIVANGTAASINNSGIVLQQQVESSNNNIIANNYIGVLADGITAAGNQGAGIWITNSSNNNNISNNIVAYNKITAGIAVATSGTGIQNYISQNSVYSNTGPGIDIGSNGVTANTGVLNTSRPNSGINYPIILPGSGISFDSRKLFVRGFIGKDSLERSAGQNGVFAGAVVEIFAGDNSPADQTGSISLNYGVPAPHPEGKIFLGTLIAASDGTFSGLINITGKGLSVSSLITGTATLPGIGTSEFGAMITPLFILPLHVAEELSINTNNCINTLSWKSATEENIDHIEIEYSADGRNFCKLFIVGAKGSNKNYYNSTAASAGSNFYRLKVIDNEGSVAYSKIVKAINKCSIAPAVQCYPNPATTTLTVTNAIASSIIQLINIQGEVLLQQKANGTGTDKLNMRKVPAGQYFIKIANDENVATIKITKEL